MPIRPQYTWHYDAGAIQTKAFAERGEAAATERIANQLVPSMIDGAVNLSYVLTGPGIN